MWEEVIVGVIIAFGLAIIGLIITLILRIGDKTDRLGDKIDNMGDKLGDKIDSIGDKIGNKIDTLPSKFFDSFINAYEAMHKIRSNPVNNRKAELLEKLKRREISYEECLELQEMLEEELKEARDKNDLLNEFIILGLISLLGAVMALLKPKD